MRGTVLSLSSTWRHLLVRNALKWYIADDNYFDKALLMMVIGCWLCSQTFWTWRVEAVRPAWNLLMQSNPSGALLPIRGFFRFTNHIHQCKTTISYPHFTVVLKGKCPQFDNVPKVETPLLKNLVTIVCPQVFNQALLAKKSKVSDSAVRCEFSIGYWDDREEKFFLPKCPNIKLCAALKVYPLKF